MTKTDNNISPFSEFRPITSDPYIQYSRLNWVNSSFTYISLAFTLSLSDKKSLWPESSVTSVTKSACVRRRFRATLLSPSHKCYFVGYEALLGFHKNKIEKQKLYPLPAPVLFFSLTVLLYSHLFSFLIKPMQSNYYS